MKMFFAIKSITVFLLTTRLSDFDTALHNARQRDCWQWCLCNSAL